MDLISIVVPVYNVEKYIDRCIKSLINQSYTMVEIIIVDDGSTDESGEICDTYIGKDNRIKVYHKKNGGLSDARNYGIDRCTGNYVTFVDSDDYVDQFYIELLYRTLKDYSADISICDCQYVFDDKFVCKNNNQSCVKVFSTYDAVIEALNIRLRQSAWGKLYKREMFKNIRFPIGLYYEDLAIFYTLLLKSKKVAFIDSPSYYYMIRSGSIMQSEFNIGHSIEIQIIDEQMDEVIERYNDLVCLANARRIYSYFLVLRRVLLSKNADDYVNLRHEIKKKIKINSKGLMMNRSIRTNIKIKLLCYMFGENTFMFCQRIADKRNPELRS